MFARIVAVCLALSGPAYAELSTELSVLTTELEAAFASTRDQDTVDNRDEALKRLVKAQDEILSITRSVLRKHHLSLLTLDEKIAVQSELKSKVLGALYSINKAPLPQLLLNPQGAVGTVEAEILFQGLIPDLNAQGERDLSAQTELSNDIKNLEAEQTKLTDFFAAIRAHRANLNQSDTAGRPLPEIFATTSGHQDLFDAAIQAIGRFSEFLKDAPALNTSERKTLLGLLSWPTNSISEIEIRDQGVGATRRQGAVIIPNPLSRLTAPASGTVLFAGNLSPNMNVIVVEPERDLQIFISGATTSTVKAGEIVQKDQMIALFGPIIDTDNRLSSNRDPDQLGLEANEIYVEVRIAGQPTDPFQWFEQEEKELIE